MPEDTLENPLLSLPTGIYEAVNGLLLLGRLEERVEFAGHSFTLRTLTMAEELEVNLVAKDYLDSMGNIHAHQWAYVAAALVAVDDDPNFAPPISPGIREQIRAKFIYCTQSWYPPVGIYLFDRLQDLLAKQFKAIQAVEDLSKRNLGNSWPTPDSSEKPGTSEEENSTPSNQLSSDIYS